MEPDRIQNLSYPGPDRSVTLEALQSYHVIGRRYRNRRIGDYLKELHLTEGRNTGFRKILRALENNGSPLPEFITDNDRSFFATVIHIHELFDVGCGSQVISEKQPEKQPEKQDVSEKQPEKLYSLEGSIEKRSITKADVISLRAKGVLEMIRVYPSVSRKDISEKLGLTQGEVRTVLFNLKAEGKFRHEGPDKGGRWVINENAGK